MIKIPAPFLEAPDADQTDRAVPWGWRDVGKALILIVFGSILVGVLVLGVALVTDNLPEQGQGMAAAPFFWLGALIYAIVILAVYLFAVRRAQGDWSLLGFRAFSQWWLPLVPVLTLVQLFGMSIINVLVVLPFTGGNFENPQIEALTGGAPLSTWDLGLLLILVAVIAPIAEEIFFRGMLYPVLRRRWSANVAIVLNGFLFALIHFIPILIPGLLFVGIVLAWVRERSDSIIPCILLHAMQNGIVLFGIYAMMSGMVEQPGALGY
jgi:uncharacterized protein